MSVPQDDDADSWEEREPSVGAEQDEKESEEEEDNIPKESPMFVPRSGRYFLHDDRQLEEEDEKKEEKERYHHLCLVHSAHFVDYMYKEILS